jgi:hypothetical protein
MLSMKGCDLEMSTINALLLLCPNQSAVALTPCMGNLNALDVIRCNEDDNFLDLLVSQCHIKRIDDWLLLTATTDQLRAR